MFLSFSNDTTPDGGGGRGVATTTTTMAAADVLGASVFHYALENAENSLDGGACDLDGGAYDMTISPDVDCDYCDDHRAHSPPPESVHSGKITTLSPPPLSRGSGAGGVGDGPPRYHASSSASLFSRGDNHGHRGGGGGGGWASSAQGNQPNGNVAVHPSSSVQGGGIRDKKKRPPLPPRWAIGGGGAGGGGGVGMGDGMVDVVPIHLPPPPKQVGPLGHRRVLSTGDSSFLSNLTDPDSAEGEGDSPTDLPPPSAVGGNRATASGQPAKPLPAAANPSSHRRGVSWACEPVAFLHGGEGGVDDDGYKTEEEAAFDTLGILQPILLDDGNDERRGDADAGEREREATGGDPVRPTLPDNGGEGEAFVGPMAGSAGAGAGAGAANSTASSHDNDAFFASATSPGRGGVAAPPRSENVPRRNLWEVVRERKSDMPVSKENDLWGVVRECKSEMSRSKKKHVAQLSQFGNEVDRVILEALHAHDMTTSDAARNAAASLEMASDASVAIDRDGESSKRNAVAAPTGRDPGDLPPKVISQPGLSRDVSALSTVESEHSPRPSVYSRQRGESIFEDSAWIPEYDAQGRIDGTLPEERDPKLMGDAWGGVDFNTDVAAAVAAAAAATTTTTTAASPRPPGHIRTSTERKDGSPRSVVEDDPKTRSSDNNPNAPPKDPTETMGLRHRKTKTIAAKNMADELSQIAALHGGGHRHQSTAAMLSNDGGVDNLFAGVGILAQAQQNGGDERRRDHPTAATGAGGDDEDIGEGDAPHDEETGGAGKGRVLLLRDAIDAVHNRRDLQLLRSSLRQRSKFQIQGFYHDVIRPKLPAFKGMATHSICFVMLPLLIIAIILYYGAGNPMVGAIEAVEVVAGVEDYKASWQVYQFDIAIYILLLLHLSSGKYDIQRGKGKQILTCLIILPRITRQELVGLVPLTAGIRIGVCQDGGGHRDRHTGASNTSILQDMWMVYHPYDCASKRMALCIDVLVGC